MADAPELAVRPVSIHDAPALAAFFAALGAEPVTSAVGALPDAEGAVQLCVGIEANLSCDVASHGGRVVGCLTLGWRFRGATLERFARHGLAVDPAADALAALYVPVSWQGARLAGLLLRRAAVHLRRRGRRRLVLSAALPAGGGPRLRFYEALGFRAATAPAVCMTLEPAAPPPLQGGPARPIAAGPGGRNPVCP
ncbi:MAG TPA: GNAT family N-acetyltransferase [Azospirillaceae bacterium]|nr:GNAT family N-acetyltransferase [Azospirillaceae bacterium]